jgi:hypothetical protein
MPPSSNAIGDNKSGYDTAEDRADERENRKSVEHEPLL